jgi:hypothetical protein
LPLGIAHGKDECFESIAIDSSKSQQTQKSGMYRRSISIALATIATCRQMQLGIEGVEA